jgi:succinoglycan biosynthesis protein ExoU
MDLAADRMRQEMSKGALASVAVIIAAKDAGSTIARAVRSALAQPEATEVVVVDDGSRDGTAQIAADCDDGSGRLRVLRQSNKGPSAARNAAIETTFAPFLCVLDADDFFAEGRLGAIFAAAGTDWELAGDRLLLAKQDAEDGPYERWRSALPVPFQLALADFVNGNITQAEHPRQELGYLKPLIRRSFLDANRLRFRENIWLGEDFLLYTEILMLGGRFRTVENYGYVSIQRPNSLSHNHPADRLGALWQASQAVMSAAHLSPAGRQAFEAYSTSLRERWLFHRALEAKQQGRWAEVVRLVLSRPGLLREAVQARVTRAAA